MQSSLILFLPHLFLTGIKEEEIKLQRKFYSTEAWLSHSYGVQELDLSKEDSVNELD